MQITKMYDFILWKFNINLIIISPTFFERGVLGFWGKSRSDGTSGLVDNDGGTDISLVDFSLHIDDNILLSLLSSDLFLNGYICDLENILISLW